MARVNRTLGDFSLRPGHVLIAFPPKPARGLVELITTDIDTFLGLTGIEEFQRLLKVPKAQWPVGVVAQIGPGTEDVWPGDVVLLEPDGAAELLDWPDAETGHLMPHLVLHESNISAILEPA